MRESWPPRSGLRDAGGRIPDELSARRVPLCHLTLRANHMGVAVIADDGHERVAFFAWDQVRDLREGLSEIISSYDRSWPDGPPQTTPAVNDGAGIG